MKKLLTLCALAALASTTLAKLPAPSPEAKAKAAETAARAAWAGKSDGYKLCVAQDQVAAKYRASAAAAGKPVPTATATATPACTDPGPFVYAAAEPAKPIEASGAHSPATTAASPPSGAQPAAVTNPTPKQ
ncbi:hypothetical protein ACSFA8_10945 [Variovorax sp. RT4R15]|uniref:hypothetical protein n=1 Tax=Variovorax sp. RT4R15 TaxID=3443737 RepID=UPI003F470F27